MNAWITPVATGALLAVFTTVIAMLNRVHFEALRSMIEVQVGAMKEDIADLRKDLSEFKEDTHRRFDRVDEKFAEIHRELASLRSDITQLALNMGRPQPQAG